MLKRFWLLCVCAVLGFPSIGSASGVFIELDSSEPWHITQKSEYVLESDVGSQSGDFSVGRASLNLKKKYKHSSGMSVDLTLSLDHYMIHDETAVDLPASLQSKGVMVGTKLPMPFVQGNRFYMGLDLGSYFQSAKDHGFDSGAFRFKGRIYGIYKKEDLVFVAGAMIQPDYEDNAAMPFVGFQYIVNDQWGFHFLSNEPYISYRVNDRLTLKCKGSGYFDEFEVVEGGRKGEIVKMTEAHVGLGMSYEVAEDFFVETDLGWAFARKYEYLKNGGKVVPDDSLYGGITVKVKF